MADELKPLLWVGPTQRDLRALPEEVKNVIGFALYVAQRGGRHPQAKPLVGFGGAGVLEVVEDHDGSTYRAVYTVRFKQAIYVLHVFQKKSKRGVATPKREIELVRQRLRYAEADHQARLSDEG